jgi:hypothetical protein
MDASRWGSPTLGAAGGLLALGGLAALGFSVGAAGTSGGVLGLALGGALILAARDPQRHWVVVLQGALVGLLAPWPCGLAAREGALPLPLAGTLALLGWALAALCLHLLARAWEAAAEAAAPERKPLRQALEEAITQEGSNLSELSHHSPLLIVFLRHFGCTFCREACRELARLRPGLEARGTRLVLVHMGSEAEAQAFFEGFGLGDVLRVGDRVRWLYRAFGLRRGSLWQLLGPRVWWRGFRAGVIHGHGIGRLEGDALQMPGVFLVHHDEMLRSHVHRDASDRPDYTQLGICPTQPSSEAC